MEHGNTERRDNGITADTVGASDTPHDKREQEHCRDTEPEPLSPELILDDLHRESDGLYHRLRRQACRPQ